ncbi:MULTISPECIES: FUSC family protein [unclassified Francisella]|uniref:FUSC family protein n=1 Tax=unclassified Francisella TaxID=2610885 RepID=UPI002E2FA8D6|nr:MULTISPECIES: FUSC family protein [unclassified Francisella]MED7820226.1 FUSC family protein [Francisella sp. 19S2-4]MED7831076.1 FUSC family protein [Francisella sp. 19S2-10]
MSQYDPDNKFLLLALRSSSACIISMLFFQILDYPTYGMWAGFYSWFLTQTDISDNLSNLNRCFFILLSTILFIFTTCLGLSLTSSPLLFALVLGLFGLFSGFCWYFSYVIFHVFIWDTCIFAYTIMINQEKINIYSISIIILISGFISVIMCLAFAIINYFFTGKTFKFSKNLFEKEKGLQKNINTYLIYGVKLSFILFISQYLLLIYKVSHGFWIIITIIVCFLPTTKDTLIRVLERVLGTFIGAIIGYIIIYFFNSNIIVLEIIFPLTLFITYYYRCHKYHISTIYLTLTTMLFINAVTPNDYNIGILRFTTTLVGTSIVIIFIKLVFPIAKKLIHH